MKRFLLAGLLAALVAAPGGQAWTWPVDGPVLRPFSFAGDPYAGGLHRGLDIGASPGAAVRSAAEGTVTFAGSLPSNGKTVAVATADGYSVTLVHLGSIAVARGATVAEGATVGTVGPSGDAEAAGPYVHLGVRVASQPEGYVDPLGLLPGRGSAPAPEAATATAAPAAVPAAVPATPPAAPEASTAPAAPASSPPTQASPGAGGPAPSTPASSTGEPAAPGDRLDATPAPGAAPESPVGTAAGPAAASATSGASPVSAAPQVASPVTADDSAPPAVAAVGSTAPVAGTAPAGGLPGTTPPPAAPAPDAAEAHAPPTPAEAGPATGAGTPAVPAETPAATGQAASAVPGSPVETAASATTDVPLEQPSGHEPGAAFPAAGHGAGGVPGEADRPEGDSLELRPVGPVEAAGGGHTGPPRRADGRPADRPVNGGARVARGASTVRATGATRVAVGGTARAAGTLTRPARVRDGSPGAHGSPSTGRFEATEPDSSAHAAPAQTAAAAQRGKRGGLPGGLLAWLLLGLAVGAAALSGHRRLRDGVPRLVPALATSAVGPPARRVLPTVDDLLLDIERERLCRERALRADAVDAGCRDYRSTHEEALTLRA